MRWLSISSWLRLRTALSRRIRNLIGLDSRVDGFVPDPCIKRQVVTFSVAGRDLMVEADFRTPLYEMVAELAGIDCYRLSDFKSAARHGCVIIDAGANVGVASLVMAATLDCTVYALEPVGENVEAMKRNLSLNDEYRVRIVQCGLAGSDRSDRLWQDPIQSVSAHFNKVATSENPSGLRPIEAEFVSLKTFMAKQGIREVMLLKLDIEGGEYEVIDSIDVALAGRIRAISLEVHDQGVRQNVNSIATRLRDLDYEVTVRPHIGRRPGLHYLLARKKVA